MDGRLVIRAASVVLVLTLAALACAPRHGPELEPGPGVYDTPGEIGFSVKITPVRFALGEPVSLETSLFNGGRGVFVKSFATGCQWDFEIASENGRVMGPARMCTMALTELRLEPGELRMIVREWKGNDDYFGAAEPLSPGRYSVTAGFVDEHQRVVPMAEPVWIEIVASRTRR